MTAAPGEPVRNLVTRPPVLVHLDDSLRKVAQFFVEESIGAAVVRGTDPPAIISERDIVRAVADGLNLDRTHVEEVMTIDAAIASPHDTVAGVARMMIDNEIRHVPIIEDELIVGLISGRDVLKSFADAADA
ncbi:MAG: CBS domain-containing protein [Acidimicrobiia bacterium]|jgi:CBS domain-containing protein